MERSLKCSDKSSQKRPYRRHWWWQRITAVLLVPAVLWFLKVFFSLYNTDYATIREYFSQPLIALFSTISLILLVKHALLGAEVIIDDYIHDPKWRCYVSYGTKLLGFLAIGVTIASMATLYSFNQG